MFRLFRQAAPARETGLAMVDPRPGDQLLVIGVGALRLAASSAAATGLNGRAVVVGRGNAQRRIAEEAAAAAGALIEFVDAPPSMLPFDPDTFNLVLISALVDPSGTSMAPVIAEAVRVAKPGGRIIAVAGEKRAGLFGALSKTPESIGADAAVALLKAAGAVAARRLATVDGVSYYEARKPR